MRNWKDRCARALPWVVLVALLVIAASVGCRAPTRAPESAAPETELSRAQGLASGLAQPTALVSAFHYPKGATNGVVYSGENWIGWTRAGLITNYAPQRALTIERCTIDGTALPGQGWGIRAYDCIDWTIARCRFANILGARDDTSDGVPDRYLGEHAIYINVAGNVSIVGCSFNWIAAQAIQTVFVGRVNESSDYAGFLNAGGTISVRNCDAYNCGLANPNHSAGGRASFAFSFFPSSQSVEVMGCEIENVGNPWWAVNPANPASPRFNSYGGILIDSHPSATVRGTTVHLDNPDVRNCDVVEVVNCTFDANGRSQVRVAGCRAVKVSGCKGNATLWVDGVVVGPVANGYVR